MIVVTQCVCDTRYAHFSAQIEQHTARVAFAYRFDHFSRVQSGQYRANASARERETRTRGGRLRSHATKTRILDKCLRTRTVAAHADLYESRTTCIKTRSGFAD